MAANLVARYFYNYMYDITDWTSPAAHLYKNTLTIIL